TVDGRRVSIVMSPALSGRVPDKRETILVTRGDECAVRRPGHRMHPGCVIVVRYNTALGKIPYRNGCGSMSNSQLLLIGGPGNGVEPGGNRGVGRRYYLPSFSFQDFRGEWWLGCWGGLFVGAEQH